MKVLMKTVDMICVSTRDGRISPLKFKLPDDRGGYTIVKIDRVLKRAEQKIAGNRMLVYTVQSIIRDTETVYEMKYEVATCKWYISKL
ncbi:MAG TPA: hypothetical protein PLP30_06095 [Clostridia bacterium]|nr:hypothetical protein [Clostridia bacterium]HPQ46919.1 hypothetical protein [Clostridia bacterium]